MSFHSPALSFTSLFGEGIKTIEHQNHIFPESGIVTCSIIESSRGSLICVPVTDGFSSDCDSYLTVTEVPKDNCFESGTERAVPASSSSSVDCLQLQHDEETESRLFVQTIQQDGPAENGSEVVLITSGDCTSPGSDHIVIHEDEPQSHPDTVTTSEPEKKVPKKKGGWPKGKKRRKGLTATAAPKAPATGYVLFLNKRRKQMQKSNPEMAFSEVTKQIGNEWTNLPIAEKKVYLKRAEEEKKRYREELRQYQQSEANRAKTMQANTPQEGKDSSDTITIPIHAIEDEDSRQLYCAVCDQLFTSIHNKKEHLYGKQHLSNITGAIHRVTASGSEAKESKDALEGAQPNLSCSTLRLRDSVVSVTDAMDLLMSLARDQVNEIDFLTKSSVNLRQHKSALERDLKLLEELYTKREEELESIKVEGKALSSQLVDLRMVPKLFGIIKF